MLHTNNGSNEVVLEPGKLKVMLVFSVPGWGSYQKSVSSGPDSVWKLRVDPIQYGSTCQGGYEQQPDQT